MKNTKMALLLLSLLLAGCITPQQAMQMTPEQIQAWASTNEDVYACLGVNGPPPNGSGFILIIPKGSNPNLNLSPSCQIVSGKVGGGGQ